MNSGKLPLSGFLFAIAAMATNEASKVGDPLMKGVYFVIGGALYVVTFYLVQGGIIASLKATLGK